MQDNRGIGEDVGAALLRNRRDQRPELHAVEDGATQFHGVQRKGAGLIGSGQNPLLQEGLEGVVGKESDTLDLIQLGGDPLLRGGRGG